MENYKKVGYIVMAIILLITIIILILIHSFNSTPESGDIKSTTTTKQVEYGN